MAMRLLTKEQMIQQLRSVQERGWIRSLRPLNSGGIGNTIDSLLGLPENNLPIADTAQWELKSHRVGSASLLTLFHMEPQPRGARIVPAVLLPKYGWPGRPGELSFRQTLRATSMTDRGFGISVDRGLQRVAVFFDSSAVGPRHAQWLQTVRARVGLGPLTPQPYWGFQELFLKASTKMLNSFYVEADTKREAGEEFFRIAEVLVLQGFDTDRFLSAIEQGDVLVDFDARTGKNHGAKFRVRQRRALEDLYRFSEVTLQS